MNAASIIIKSHLVTSSCMSSQTMLRYAIDGWETPSRKCPSPLSQIFSSFDKEDNRTFSASAAAFGLSGRPVAGPSTVFIT